MLPSLVRWSFSGCVLLPPTTRLPVLILVLAVVLVLLFRGYDLATTLAVICGAGLLADRLSQRLVHSGPMSITVPPPAA